MYTLSSTPIPATSVTAAITHQPDAMLRDRPSLLGSRIERLAYAEVYPVLGRNTEATWLLLQIEDKQGWVWGQHLQLSERAYHLPVVCEE